MFETQQHLILQKKQEFEYNMNIAKIVTELQNVSQALKDEVQVDGINRNITYLERTKDTAPNMDDIDYISPKFSSIIRRRINVMTKEEYCYQMRKTNLKQRDLILHAIHHIHQPNGKPIQIFFTGPAGSGKTFTLHLLMETYNRFCQKHNSYQNAYMACASTGKAAVNIGGTTVHSAFHICPARSKNREYGLSPEVLQTFRHSFANVEIIFIDEISMISADILNSIHSRLTDINGNFDDVFAGKNIIFCGDLRQLPPVNARPIPL